MTKPGTQSGNVFLTLFAAVAVVGAIGFGSVSLLQGPVSTMVALNKTQIAEMRMEIAAKLVMAQAVSTFASDGDTGTDYIETIAFAAGTITGGGVIPTTLGINDIDPWGNNFGYCVWDHGSVTASANRLAGTNAPTFTAIAMVSSGSNRVFETVCSAFADVAPADGNPDTPLIAKAAGGDDIIVSYTYNEALATMGDFWRFRGDSTDTQNVTAIDQNLDLKEDVTVTGTLQFSLPNSGLVLADSPGASCNAAQEGQLFLDSSSSPPSVVICNAGVVEPIAAGGGGSGATPSQSCGAGDTTTINNIVHGSSASNPTTTHTLSNYVVPNLRDRVLIVTVSTDDDNGAGHLAGAVTFGGTALTLAGTALAGSDQSAAMFYLLNPAAGTGDIVVTTTGPVEALQVGAFTADCIVQQAPEATAQGTATATSISTTITTLSSNAIVFDVLENDASLTNTVTASGQFHLFSGSSASSGTSSYGVSFNAQQAAGARTMGWSTTAGNTLAHFAAAFKTSGVGASNIDVTSGLVAHWKLDEITGSSIIDSVGSATGTWTDGTGDSVAEESVAGQVGTALTFDNSNDVISFGDVNDLSQSHTLSAWINPTSFGRILSKTDGSTGWYFTTIGTGQLSYHNLQLLFGINVYTPPNSAPNGVWSHVVAVRDATRNRVAIYVNGQLQAERLDLTGTTSDTAHPLAIGNHSITPNASDAFSGAIDDVRIYNRVLTDGEIQALYSGSTLAGQNAEDERAKQDLGFSTYIWGNEFSQRTFGLGNLNSPYLVNGLHFIDHSGGVVHCGIETTGIAKCWGLVIAARGDGDTSTSATVPSEVANIKDFARISVGWDSVCAIRRNGELWCWGDDSAGEIGNGPGTVSASVPVRVTAFSDFVDIAGIHAGTGASAFCAVRRGGSVWCWGSDLFGVQGNGDASTANVDSPAQISGLSDIVQIKGADASAAGLFCALNASGDVWCWGGNANGQTGDGTTITPRAAPVKANTGKQFVQIAVGDSHGCGLETDGDVWCWGNNSSGRLGNGTNVNSLAPVKALIGNVVQISASAANTYFVTSDGAGWSVGATNQGALGNGGVTGDISTPAKIPGLSNVVKIFTRGAFGAAAITKAPTDGVETPPAAPYEITQSGDAGQAVGSHGLSVQLNSTTTDAKAGIGFAVDATSIASGDTVSASIMANTRGVDGRAGMQFSTKDAGATTTGRFYIDETGRAALTSGTAGNIAAMLATGTTTGITWPTNYLYGLSVTDTSAATDQHGFFGLDEDTGYSTLLFSKDFVIAGSDDTGGTLIPLASFIAGGAGIDFSASVEQVRDGGTITVTAHSATAGDTAMIEMERSSGSVGAPGAVSNGDIMGAARFTGYDGAAYDADGQAQIIGRVGGAVSGANVPSEITIRTAAAGTPDSTSERLTIKADGKVGVGQASPASLLHVGGRGATDEGVKIGNDTVCSGASDEGTIRWTGSAIEYCDGSTWQPWNNAGGAGGNSFDCEHGAKIIDMALGEGHSCALYDNGRVYCWGRNDNNQIAGVSAANPEPTPLPVQEYYVDDAVSISAGQGDSTFIVKKDGSVVSFGLGNHGRLGNGISTNTTYDYTQVLGGVKWKTIYARWEQTCGISKDNTAYCWGAAFGTGRLGNNATSDEAIPAKVFNVSGAIDLGKGHNHNCAALKNGDVWCWGNNSDGQLGNGTTTSSNRPVKANITDVINIDTSRSEYDGGESTCAVKRDGTIWCWGSDHEGQLGNGAATTGDQTNPVQVSGITNAIEVEILGRAACALLSDGTIKCWGTSDDGVLGNGALSPQTSPGTAVSGIDNAVKIVGAGRAYCAVLDNGRAKCWGRADEGQLGNGSTANPYEELPVDVISPLTCDADKIVFTTATAYTGNLGGIAGADAKCQAEADALNLPGTYYAWLSDDTTSPAERFNRDFGAYYLSDRTTKIADDWADLTDGTLDNPIGGPGVWTNVAADGSSNGHTNSCAGWTSDALFTYSGNVGDGTSQTSQWNIDPFNSPFACSGTASLYCFQQ